MKYCSKKHTNPDDAVFCNECGEKLGIQTTEKTKKCPNCSADNPADAEFCHHCGTSLTVKKPETNQSLKKEETETIHESINEQETSCSTNSDNVIKEIVQSINESFRVNYNITEILLGKICMWICTIVTVFALYRFINHCISDDGSGWGLVNLIIIISYIGLCYRKKFWTKAWALAYAIRLIGYIDLLASAIGEDLLEAMFDLYPVGTLEMFFELICVPIAIYRIYKQRDLLF